MFKILYICTHNRCRSILSEAITNHLSAGQIIAKSAGSRPAGEVHPLSLKYLKEYGAETSHLSSQSWHEFEHFDADLVVTVCDSAAGESCPLWFGQPVKMHWELADPSKLAGSETDKADAFRATIRQIEQRVQAMLALPLGELNATALKSAMHTLGAV